VTLLTRVIKLESRVKVPAKRVQVVFQQIDNSHEKMASRLKTENRDSEAMVIVVKFVEPLKP